ncbi:hypothetical protein V1638_00040 [Pseudarthrobacter sp. J64]|uniref:hypothetical protein n=1 Tax=Pseudarthrobacter sp. J64 TaxID=3116485 RepID=UPI002E821A7A|nr:hypothetical protein [Pseudarthrobacter sp. J64]MEE2567789.1 hypothetical protein [Pseudarthrobacter sp. J64]
MHPKVSFEDARRIVARSRQDDDWQGHYMVADFGFESPEHWLVIDGDRELIVDGDPQFLRVGSGPVLMAKSTGELIELPSLYDFDYIASFTPVGDVPPDYLG